MTIRWRTIFLLIVLIGVSTTQLADTVYKVFLRDAKERRALCNDGTNPIFYKRLTSSSRWHIHLMGGGGCYSIESCNDRKNATFYLMTSSFWNNTLVIPGIGSASPSINPAFWNDNFIYLVYCSSDWHSGNRDQSPETGGYYFNGKNIVKGVIDDLLDSYGLDVASTVFLSGTSAGGIGVWSNANDIYEQIVKKNPKVDYNVLSDSGWFLDGKGLVEYPCTNSSYCNYQKRMMTGMKYWNVVPQKECEQAYYPQSEVWKCMVGYHVYPFVKHRKLAIVYQYDLWNNLQDGLFDQLTWKKMSEKQLEWVNARGVETVESLHSDKVESVTAIGCYGHAMLIFPFFQNIRTQNGTKLNDLIESWANGGNDFVVIDDCENVQTCNKYCKIWL